MVRLFSLIKIKILKDIFHVWHIFLYKKMNSFYGNVVLFNNIDKALFVISFIIFI